MSKAKDRVKSKASAIAKLAIEIEKLKAIPTGIGSEIVLQRVINVHKANLSFIDSVGSDLFRTRGGVDKRRLNKYLSRPCNQDDTFVSPIVYKLNKYKELARASGFIPRLA